MKFDIKFLNQEINDDEEKAKLYFSNMVSEHGIEKIEKILNDIEEVKWINIFKNYLNWEIKGNILLKNKLIFIRNDNSRSEKDNIVETVFGSILLLEDRILIRFNDITGMIQIFDEEKLIYESNSGYEEILLKKGFYKLIFNKKKYILNYQ